MYIPPSLLAVYTIIVIHQEEQEEVQEPSESDYDSEGNLMTVEDKVKI